MTPKRTALITGSGKNIGRAIALRLAKGGMNLIIHGGSDLDACEPVSYTHLTLPTIVSV